MKYRFHVFNTFIPVLFSPAIAASSRGGKVLFFFFFLTFSEGNSQYFTKDSIVDAGSINVACRGAAWGDFNNDGNDDIFLAVYAGPSRLFRNSGNGNFAEEINSGIEVPEKAIGALWGDYDNDTLVDLFVFTENVGNYLYHNDGNGKFTLTDQANDVVNSFSASWADVNNDGFIDLFVCGYKNLPNFFYINNGNGKFTKIGAGESPIVSKSGNFSRRRASFSDFNNDGYPDLHICGFLSGPDPGDTTNYLFINNAGAFSQSDIDDLPFMARTMASAWGDYNNDGYQDLLIVASAPGASGAIGKLCTNKGILPFQDLSPNIGDNIKAADNPIWFDFDNDGYLDIFAIDVNYSGKAHFFRNFETDSFSRVLNDPLAIDNTGAYGAGTSDFDNDGDDDLFLSCNTKNYLYKNNSNTNHWIKIRLYGVVSNYCAIGAKIKVKAEISPGKTVWLMREVMANAITSQSSFAQVFGLGTATIIDSILIYWPSGNLQELANIPVDQYPKIRESTVNFVHTTLCGTLKARFYNTSPIQGPYFWNFGDGTPDTSTSDTNSFVHTFLSTGHFQVTLKDQSGKAVRRDSVFIDSSGIEQVILSGPLVIPNNTQNVEYSIPYKYGSRYKWTVTGGMQISGDSSNKITVNWGIPGKGFIKVAETLINYCSGRFAKDTVILLENHFIQAPSSFPTETLRTSTCTWVDIDNDGFIDLYVTNENGMAALFKYNGNFFNQVSGVPLVQDVNSVTGCAWGDYDNDGLIDVFVTRKNQQNNLLFHNEGNGNFSGIKTGALVTNGGDSYSATWGDYNRDGLIDLFVANQNGVSFLYKNTGDGKFIAITDASPVLKSMQALNASWMDYDNNNTLDLFVTRLNEKNQLFKNIGDSAFVIENIPPFDSDSSHSFGASWADMDNDRDMDLFIPNNFGNNNFLYENTGDGNFVKITNGEIMNDAGFSSSSSWADFDNDGDEDLLVTNEGGNNFLYKNNGDKTFLKITNEITVNDQSNSLAGAWFDYDNSGTLDLYVANDDKDLFYRTTDFGLNWLGIHCKGVISNASALGTKIQVKANTGTSTGWQMRVVSDHSGHGSQNGLLQHFGLGNASICDSIKIVWLSGRIQYLTNVSVNKIITVTESNLPVIRGKKVCAGSFVTLNAEGELIKWYESDTAMEPLITGNIFNTPLLNDNITYYVTNTVTGGESERLPVTVTVLPKPKANFSASDTLKIVSEGSIQFTDQSVSATFWQWDFGDGDTSLIQNPLHIYSQPGYYSVKLKVGNSLCSPDSMVKNKLIHITSSIFEDGVDKNSLIIIPYYDKKSIFVDWKNSDIMNWSNDCQLSYQVISLTGQKVSGGKLDNTGIIKVSDLPEGIYLLNLNSMHEKGKSILINRKLVWY